MATKKAVAYKPSAEALNSTTLTAALVAHSGVDKKQVKAVLASLTEVISGQVGKKGSGTFVLPGLLKITSVKVPAKPKRKGIDPFTKAERVFAAKPATIKVKVRPLKKLKDAAK